MRAGRPGSDQCRPAGGGGGATPATHRDQSTPPIDGFGRRSAADWRPVSGGGGPWAAAAAAHASPASRASSADSLNRLAAMWPRSHGHRAALFLSGSGRRDKKRRRCGRRGAADRWLRRVTAALMAEGQPATAGSLPGGPAAHPGKTAREAGRHAGNRGRPRLTSAHSDLFSSLSHLCRST